MDSDQHVHAHFLPRNWTTLTPTITDVKKLMTFNHKTNPINLKDNQDHTTSEQFPAFNPRAYKHGSRPLSLSMQRGRALISNGRECRSKGVAFMMIWERTPDRGSRGPVIGVTTPGPQTTLCPRENTTVLLCPDPPIHMNRGPQRTPASVPTTFA